MKSIAEILQDHPFVAGLEDDIVTFIAGCAKNVVFKPDEYIFREGDPAENFYLIRQGTVALEMFVPGQTPQVFLTIKKGEMLGASWLVPPHQWSYDARAVKLTRAISFECKCLLEKCESDHHVGYEMMKRFIPPLVERLEIARIQSIDLYGSNANA